MGQWTPVGILLLEWTNKMVAYCCGELYRRLREGKAKDSRSLRWGVVAGSLLGRLVLFYKSPVYYG